MQFKNISTSLFIAVIAMLIGISSMNAQEKGKAEMMKRHHQMNSETAAVNFEKVDSNLDGNVFACIMGCVVTDEAGKCPKCEMKLKEMSIDDAGKLLKSKGMPFVDKSSGKKECGPDSTKPCCDGKKSGVMMKTTMDKKDCAADCTKPCCAEKSEAGVKCKMDKKDCADDCTKPCCEKKG